MNCHVPCLANLDRLCFGSSLNVIVASLTFFRAALAERTQRHSSSTSSCIWVQNRVLQQKRHMCDTNQSFSSPSFNSRMQAMDPFWICLCLDDLFQGKKQFCNEAINIVLMKQGT